MCAIHVGAVAHMFRSTIQTQTGIASLFLKGVTEDLSKNAELYNRTVVFPSTNYPGRTQENILGQLLRKKLEPQVENWVEDARRTAETVEGGEAEDEFLDWASQWLRERIQKYATEEATEDYTAEEKAIGIENVNTGLKSDYEDEESVKSNDDEQADSEMAVTGARRTSLGQVEYSLGQIKQPKGKASTMEEILRFATTGVVTDPLSGRR